TSAAFAQLTDQQGARFDLAKFDFLATVGAPPGLWLVGPNSTIKTVKQAIDAKMKWRWAASGPADGLGNGAAFTCEALKLDCQIVPGYGGSAQAGLAVTRGEMDAVYVPESSANNFVKAKQNLALATIGRKKSRWFLDHPTIFEAVELDAEQTWLFDFFTGVEEMGRIMILPPSMPRARLAFLQQAVKETLHNPQLIAEGERTERIIEYLDPDSTRKNAQKIVSNVTPEQKKRVQATLARNSQPRPGAGSSRAGKRREPQRRGAAEGEQHAPARRRMQPVLGRRAHHLGAERISHDQPGILREDVAGHVNGGGEEQPVAMQAVVHPFRVGAKVGDRGLDLDDPERAVSTERHQIGAPPRRQRQLAHDTMPVRAQEPRRAARDGEPGGRLTAIHRERCGQ